MERKEGTGQGDRLRVAARFSRSGTRRFTAWTVLAAQPRVRYSGDAAIARCSLPEPGSEADRAQQLGQCAIRPCYDEGWGGSRPAVCVGGRQVRRGAAAEAGLS